MTRSTLASLALILLALTGCSESTTPTDSGIDSTTPTVDSGAEDSGSADAGTDAFVPMDAPSSDGGGGTDGSLLPPSDAGDPFGDAGPLGAPPWIPLDVLTDGTSCDPLVACGGDEVGTWDVEGGCVEFVLPEELTGTCPDSEITRAEGRARGRVVFDGTMASRIAQSEVTVQITIGGFCAAACSTIETMLRERVSESDCVSSAGSCVCEARQHYTIDDSDAYTIDDAMDHIVSSTGKRWAYCVEGTSMRYEDVSPEGDREPGIIDLTER